MDAIPFIIERLSDGVFINFLENKTPKLDNEIQKKDNAIQELLKIKVYMRRKEFLDKPKYEKHFLTKGLRLTARKVGKFMREIHDQKRNEELVEEWADILNIFAGLVDCCDVLKGNQPIDVNEEYFSEMKRINNQTGSSGDPKTSDWKGDQPRLGKQDSKTLFWSKALPGQTPDSELLDELDNLPQLIYELCNGDHLALVLLGSLLSLREQTNDSWSEVAYALCRDPNENFWDIINYCYEDLPYFLKPCFLYLACYPRDYQIPSRFLIHIWIAEGFISAKGKEETLEERAYKYLEQLVKRSLIKVLEVSSLGRIKSCSVDPVIHTYLILKSKEEGFLVPNPDKQTIVSQFRVAIHSNKEYKHENLEIDHMHSLLSFESKENILGNAMFLRVLHLQDSAAPCEGTLENMTHIRYLCLRNSTIDKLPESIKGMENLQTLDVRDTGIKELPITIWNISKLQHVYVSPTPKFEGPPKEAKLEDLQTLKTVVVPGSWVGECRDKFLSKLRKLALSIPKNPDWKFVSGLLSQLKGLLSLTIIIINSDSVPSGSADTRADDSVPSGCTITDDSVPLKSADTRVGISNSVPSEFVDTRAFPDLKSVKSIRLQGRWNCRNLMIDNVEFPTDLTKLILSKSGLKEDPMPALGRLKKLKFLCLKDGAYTGEEMICTAHGFPELQFLELSNLNNLENWVVEPMGMSKLRKLHVVQCQKLKNKNHLNLGLDTEKLFCSSFPSCPHKKHNHKLF